MKFWKGFKALGTDIMLLIDCGQKEEADIAMSIAEKDFKEFENRFSRFIKGNELDELNTESNLKVSEEMRSLLIKAKKAYEDTDGIFDPTVLSTLENIGYKESFEKGAGRAELSPQEIQEIFSRREKFDKLEIEDGIVKKPKELRIEFGGIGKGYLVDLIAERFSRKFQNFWISAGGDIFMSGHDDDKNWKVKVQNPAETDKDVAEIEVKNGNLCLATSGIIKRRGGKGETEWHHIIDPRTGLPVKNEILSVTAIAPSVLLADVYAKTVLILGIKEGLEFIEKQKDSACLIITKDLEKIVSDKMKQLIS